MDTPDVPLEFVKHMYGPARYRAVLLQRIAPLNYRLLSLPYSPDYLDACSDEKLLDVLHTLTLRSKAPARHKNDPEDV